MPFARYPRCLKLRSLPPIAQHVRKANCTLKAVLLANDVSDKDAVQSLFEYSQQGQTRLRRLWEMESS